MNNVIVSTFLAFGLAIGTHAVADEPRKPTAAPAEQRVVNEAYRPRQESGESKSNGRLSPAWKSEASTSMHDRSKAMIQNVKS